VVRQTISKWEKGLSVPDAEMLIRLAEIFEVPAEQLLGETIEREDPSALQELAAKLEILNEQFAQQNERRRKFWRAFFIGIGVVAGVILLREAVMYLYSQYLTHNVQEDLSVIGGADGPTKIFVARSSGGASIFTIGALLLVAVVGIWKSRPNR
jgi:putative transcriptional regulator